MVNLLATILAIGIAVTPAAAADLRGRPRLLIVSAPRADDPALAGQRALLAPWRQGAADRDLRMIEIVGADDPQELRRRHAIDPRRFAVVLIGKDGHVAHRAAMPLASERIAALIDAMPMRRAGER